jgi:Protein of unknown function (DUF1236)
MFRNIALLASLSARAMEKHCEEKSMTNRFLISVAAAALIAGTGFANAQGPGGMSREGGSGSTMQHSAPSGGGAAQPRDAAEPKASQSEKAPGQGMKAEGREGKSGTVGQAPDKSGTTTTQGREDRMNAQGREGKEGKEGKSGTVGQAPDKSGTTTTQGREDRMNTQGREDRMNAPGQKGATEPNRAQTTNPGGQTTTGNAATSAVAAPPPEKRTQIVSAIKSERIEDVGANVHVNVAVGTRLPDTVRFYPLPPRIVEIYPEWRGYEVIRIHGRYVIVQPQTREIVYVIEG